MQFKPVPDPPDDLETVETILRAVPTDPESVDDCCGTLVADAPVSTRDDAASWLTFLRALELAEETGTGYRRRSPEGGLDLDRLRRGFRDRVYGVDAVLEVHEAADRPLAGDEVARRVAERTAHGRIARGRDRSKDAGSGAERAERILEWAVLLDQLVRDGDRYRSR